MLIELIENSNRQMLGSEIVSAKNENIDICVGETDARCHNACSIEIWLISSEDNRYRWKTRDLSCIWFSLYMCVGNSLPTLRKASWSYSKSTNRYLNPFRCYNTSLQGTDFLIVQIYVLLFVMNFSSSRIIPGFIWDTY